MAQAFIQSLALEAYPASLDLSALTSLGAVWNVKQGYTGADWVHAPGGGGFQRRKKWGDGQLSDIVGFNDVGSAVTQGITAFGITATFLAGDEFGGGSGGSGLTTWTIPASQANSGVRFSSIAAPNDKYKTLHMTGRVDEGTYVLKASLLSGAVTAQTITLTPDASSIGWTVPLFCGASATDKLVLEIRRTVANGNAGVIYVQEGWIPVPTAAPIPRAYARQQWPRIK